MRDTAWIVLVLTMNILISGLLLAAPDLRGQEIDHDDVDVKRYPDRSMRYFTENLGQVRDSDVKYYAQGGSNRIGLTEKGIIHCIGNGERSFVYHMEFDGCSLTSPEGRDPMDSVSNFIHGDDPDHWIKGVHQYRGIHYENIYPDIDLRFRLESSIPKYDLIVRPGGDPERIRLTYKGVDTGLVDSRISINTPLGRVIEEKPISHMKSGLHVESRWITLGENTYTISIGDYDRSGTLVIDPYIYYSTLLGGSGYESCVSTMDREGYVYTSGSTSSADFPTSLGCYDNTYESSEVFLTKFDKKGDRFLFSTYIGGGDGDHARDIVLDDSGNIYLSGNTDSSDFPTTDGAFQEGHQGYTDVFALKMNNKGDDLLYSTYIGTYSDRTYEQEGGGNIDIDDKGYVYVAGLTGNPDFPFTSGAYSTQTYGEMDFFLMKLNKTFDSIIFCTSVGGSRNDYISYVKVLDDGSVIVAGETFSPDFPTTTGAYDRSHNGDFDAIVVRFSKTGSDLLDSTYIGGSENDYAYGFDIDENGNCLITGKTESSGYPITSNAFDRSISGDDAFITVLNSTFSKLDYSTFLGGADVEIGRAIIHLNGSEVLAGGYTRSGDFTIKESWFNDTFKGGSEAFLVKVNVSNGTLLMSTLLGGSGGESIYDLCQDSNKDYLTISGTTSSKDFPLTKNNVDNVFDTSRSDIFVMKCVMKDPITAPKNLSVDCGDGYVNLSWDPPGILMGDPVLSYSIYSGSQSDNLTPLYELPREILYLNLTGLTNGSSYLFSVAGNVWFCQGPMSNIIEGIPSTRPLAPRNLSLSAGDSFVDLRWDEPTFDGGAPITGYNIYRASGGELKIVGSSDAGENHFRDIGVENGQRYTFMVKASNIGGPGSPSAAKTVLVGRAPSSPVNVSVIPSSPLELTVSWDAPLRDYNIPIDHYTVMRSVDDGEDTMLSNVPLTEFVDSGLEMNRTYSYRILAVNELGAGPLSGSNSSRSMVPPGMVSSIDVEELDREVVLSWDPPIRDGGGGITHYGIFRGQKSDSLELVDTTEENSYSDRNLTNGVVYHYSVRAFNPLDSSPDWISVRGSPYTTPEGPVNVTYVRGDSSLILSWDPPRNDGGREVSGYDIEYRVAGEDNPEHIRGISNESMEITKLNPGTLYEVYVRAVNQRGSGNRSDVIRARAITLPEPPSVIEEVSTGDGNVTISWKESGFDGGDGLSGYNVFRNGEEVAMVDNLTTEYTDTDLINGVEYTYGIAAVNQLGAGEITGGLVATPFTVPGRVHDVEAVQSGDGLFVSWTRPPENGGADITGYNIYRDGNLIGEEQNGVNFTDLNIEANVDYSYTVGAVNARGEGEISEEVSGVFHLVPGIVKEIEVSQEDFDVIISWTEPDKDGGSPITGYRVYRMDGDGSLVLVGETGPEELSYEDQSAAAGRTYQYTVAAVNGVGEGETIDPIEITVDERLDFANLLIPTLIVVVLGILAVVAMIVIIARNRSGEDDTEPEEVEESEEEPDQSEIQESEDQEIEKENIEPPGNDLSPAQNMPSETPPAEQEVPKPDEEYDLQSAGIDQQPPEDGPTEGEDPVMERGDQQ